MSGEYFSPYICRVNKHKHLSQMNTTKHTPGPWTVSPSSKASTLTRVFSVDEGRLVASANGPGLSESGEAEANARLIAAAPELLEALELFLSCKVTNDQQNEAARIARAAIAKATGTI